MVKGNCAQSVVPRHGEKINSFGLLRCPCILINRKDVVTLLGNLSPIY